MKRLVAPDPGRAKLTHISTQLSGGPLLARAMGAYDYVPHALTRSRQDLDKPDPASGNAERHAKVVACWEEALDELGFVLAMNLCANVVRTDGGVYECHIDGHWAIGETWPEAVVRASLLKFDSERDRS